MPGTLCDETVNEALDAHINGAVRGMDNSARGDKARTDRDGIIRSSCPIVGTIKGTDYIGSAYAVLDGANAYTMQYLCESARINEVFATMQRIWESASLPAAAPANQPAPAEPAAFDPGTYLDPGYDALARTPDDFKDQKVYVGGKILQVQEDTSGTTYRIAQNSDYGSVVMAFADATALGGSRLLEDDIVDLYGVYKGLYTYKAVLGQSVTVPLIKADKIILQSENV